jgi:RNA polymerase sigma-70 factor (ECF subfamily)
MNVQGELAEDIVQETLAQLWHKAHLFDAEKAALSTWLFRIARNKLIDVRRKHKDAMLDAQEPMLQPGEVCPPDEALAQVQYEVLLKRLMADLPNEQRELLHLSFFHGLSHGQIAAQTGQPLGTVKSRLRLALVRLRHSLDGQSQLNQDARPL